MTNEIHLQRAADAEVLDGDPGGTIAVLADRAGTLTSNRSFMRAGSEGAPPHQHQRSAELFYVLDGALDVLLEDRIVTLERGDLLVVPPASRTRSPRPPTATPTSCSSSPPARPAPTTTGCWTAPTAARPSGRRSAPRRSASTTTTSKAPPGRSGSHSRAGRSREGLMLLHRGAEI